MAVRPNTSTDFTRTRRVAVLALMVMVASVVIYAPRASAEDSITVPDGADYVGTYSSMALDSAGNPVIAYYDTTHTALKVLHCDDPNCAPGGDSIVTPDLDGDVGRYPSIVMDAVGNPVVAYYDMTNEDLKILHCADPNCSTKSSITSPHSLLDIGEYPSLVLDKVGNPVVSFYQSTLGRLLVLHCDDPDCAGVGDPISSPDSTGDDVGLYSSLVLDGAGNPVVAYYDVTNDDLKVLNCDDPVCEGSGEWIATPDSTNAGGEHPTMALDGAGYPVVAYYAAGDLKLLHCYDALCFTNNSVASPDTVGDVGIDPSLVLDRSGHPLVSYYDLTNSGLKVLRCGDRDCGSSTNSIVSPDTAGLVGRQSSLALDAAGYPVVSYFDNGGGDLKVLHCDDAACGIAPTAADDSASTAQATTLNSPAPGLLGNDTDLDSDTLTASIAGLPANGVATVNSDGSFSYTPDSTFVGIDTFVYAASDGSDSSSAQVFITVTAATSFCAGRPASIDMTNGASGIGTAGDDVILGTPGADTIDGNGGDDYICGEGGNDTIAGGDGLDFIFGADGNDTLTGGDGNDRIRGGPGVDIISGEAGNDFLYGGIEGDTIDGGDGNDTIGGFGGGDTINAGPGNDLVFGGFGPDTINGGPGDDELLGLIGDDIIHGDDGNDTVSGNNGRDQLFGDDGNDLLFGGNSLDTINGNDGDDNLNGGKADDTLSGGAGTDVCTGNKGTDTAATCETTFGVP